MRVNGYRCMWVIAMFDLPVRTKKERHAYAHFRKFLLRDGFIRMQYSIYLRNCPSEENAAVHVRRVERTIPPDGEVRLLTITDKQFERMRVFFGKIRGTPEVPPKQLELF